jgi:YegS/Rv2252/BmrU family lipid kinase
MKKVLLFVNPNSRQGESFAEEIKTWLNDNGFELLNPTFDHKHEKISDVIIRHAKEQPLVLVGGGDGSINEALPGLLETKLPLVVIPLGTANNFARSLSLPTDPKEALKLLTEGQELKVDVGVANDIPFMNVIGVGLSTQVNRHVQKGLKKYLGVLAFVLTALKVVRGMTPFRVEVEYDNQVHRAYSWQISICNGRNYGNGLVIHEEASLQDGLLHGLSTEVKRWWQAFTLVPALLTGRYRPEHDVTILSGKTMTLKTKRPTHVDIDGDIKTKTPVSIHVLEKSLSVLVPPPQESKEVEAQP